MGWYFSNLSRFDIDPNVKMVRSQVCDGEFHCTDGSDEASCFNWICEEGRRKCSDGWTCVLDSQICDGISGHCPWGTDEHNCTDWTCTAGYTKCADGIQCLARSSICDRIVDCIDGSDELCHEGCYDSTEKENNILKRCPEDVSICFPINKYCDAKYDCPQGGDESSCACQDWDMVQCEIDNTKLCAFENWVKENVPGLSCLELLEKGRPLQIDAENQCLILDNSGMYSFSTQSDTTS